jgi:catechol 2,3-dioxygenase-like lactoylglutathione lyase family enzyme
VPAPRRTPSRDLRLPASVRRRQPLLRLDDRRPTTPRGTPVRRRQPLHAQSPAGRARGRVPGRRSIHRAARGGADQAATPSRQAAADRCARCVGSSLWRTDGRWERRLSMLGDHPIDVVPLATDLDASKEFYAGKLGLEILDESEDAITYRRRGRGHRLRTDRLDRRSTQERTGHHAAEVAPRWCPGTSGARAPRPTGRPACAARASAEVGAPAGRRAPAAFRRPAGRRRRRPRRRP